jgi:hypothetical protein
MRRLHFGEAHRTVAEATMEGVAVSFPRIGMFLSLQTLLGV